MYFLGIRALTLSVNILKYLEQLLFFVLCQGSGEYRIGKGAIFVLQLTDPLLRGKSLHELPLKFLGSDNEMKT